MQDRPQPENTSVSREGLARSPLAWVDGGVTDLASARVPLEDRGLLFGEAAYEVVLTRGTRLFAWDEHRARLVRTLGGIGLDADLAMPVLDRAVEELLGAAPSDEHGMLYLQVTGGTTARDHVPPADPQPAIQAFLRAFRFEALEEQRARGIALMTGPDRRWPHATFKTTQLLGNVLSKRDAVAGGADEVLLVDAEGHLLEGSSSNVFFVVDGVAWTAPVTANILPGITRQLLMRTFPDGCREETLPVSLLDHVSEAFITSTTRPVVGVASIDGRRIGTEVPGPVTRQCAAALDALMGLALGARG